MLGERPPRSVDEAWPSASVCPPCYGRVHGEPRESRPSAVNAADVDRDRRRLRQRLAADGRTTCKRAAKLLRPMLESRHAPVVTGFNGATLDGRPTTLGRGGSDFSASILAAALDAQELWIWTDVDGIMSADPRLVPNAKVLDEITYAEAAELAYNGAKVLHPRTLAPLVEKRIPVWSKNSFAPEKPGTRIVPELSVARRRARRHVHGERGAGIHGAGQRRSQRDQVMARALDALAHANVEILAITSSSYRQSFCFLVRQ